ncbi:MAG: class I SAM-dependent methyltransferase [candidate division WOR-3 bacterium]
MPHKFNPEFADRLDGEGRRSIQPPERIFDLIDFSNKGVIVDIGAGTGYFSIPLAQRFPKSLVYCLDIQDEMLRILKEKVDRLNLKNIRILKSEENKLPLEDDMADVVIMAHVFHELEDPVKIFNEVKRILKENGEFLVIDWKPIPTDFGPPLEERKDISELLSVLNLVGFKGPKEFDVYEYQHVVVSRK